MLFRSFKSIVDGGDFIEFFSLKFGFFLYDENGDNIQSALWPGNGNKFLSTDQNYIENIPLNLTPGKKFTLHVWAEDAGIFYDTKIDIDTPSYRRPFMSWTWNATNEQWDPPIPYPQDGLNHLWNDIDHRWETVDYVPANSAI